MTFCRNPHCRTKLKAPAPNRREAFCARGCHTSFYLNRCLSCEGPIQRRNKTQKVCRKTQCRNAWRAKAGFGRYSPSTVVSSASKTPNSIGSKWPPKPDRAWRQVAGPKLTTSQLHQLVRDRSAPAFTSPPKPWPKPTRKIAPTGVSTMLRR